MTRSKNADTQRYLSKHPLLRTDDLDEARFCVAQKFCDHRLETRGPNQRLEVEHNHAAGRGISLNYLHYGADVKIDPGMLNSFYLLQIPLSGHAQVIHRGKELDADIAAATILNPDRDTKMQWYADCRKLLLQVNKDHLNAVAEEIVGAPLPGPIRFEGNVDLKTNNGAVLKHLVLTCAKAIDLGDLCLGQGNGFDLRVERDLAHALLTLQKSNVSHIVANADTGATVQSLRKAIEFMHANLQEPVSITDIAHHAGVNVRTLQKGFHKRFGTSPMRYFRNIRLDAAHYKLAERRNSASVTDVAFDCGFSHLGRFSRDFKRRFGVLPSRSN